MGELGKSEKIMLAGIVPLIAVGLITVIVGMGYVCYLLAVKAWYVLFVWIPFCLSMVGAFHFLYVAWKEEL